MLFVDFIDNLNDANTISSKFDPRTTLNRALWTSANNVDIFLSPIKYVIFNHERLS